MSYAGPQDSVYFRRQPRAQLFFQRISITIQRFNSILLHNSFSSDEE